MQKEKRERGGEIEEKKAEIGGRASRGKGGTSSGTHASSLGPVFQFYKTKHMAAKHINIKDLFSFKKKKKKKKEPEKRCQRRTHSIPGGKKSCFFFIKLSQFLRVCIKLSES